MAKTTTYMGLVKPDLTDAADITKINTDMDTLDGHVHNGGSSGLAVQMVQNGALSGRPAAGHLGQLYVASDNGGSMAFDNGSAWVQLQSGAAVTKLQEISVSSTQATLLFSNIPGTYRSLRLVLVGRTDDANTNAALYVLLNGDATANYDYTDFRGVSGSTYATDVFAATGAYAGALAAGTALSGLASSVEFWLPAYAQTTFQKTWRSLNEYKGDTVSGYLVTRVVGGYWRSSAAITSLTLQPSSGNFVSGCIAQLYGVM